ncbi:unnamed protein product [Arctogadus glacialis]
MLCGGAVWTLEGQEDVVFVTACSQSATEAWGHGDSRCPLTGTVTRRAPRAGPGYLRGNQQLGAPRAATRPSRGGNERLCAVKHAAGSLWAARRLTGSLAGRAKPLGESVMRVLLSQQVVPGKPVTHLPVTCTLALNSRSTTTEHVSRNQGTYLLGQCLSETAVVAAGVHPPGALTPFGSGSVGLATPLVVVLRISGKIPAMTGNGGKCREAVEIDSV